jgi:hypothetical protein
MTEKIIKITDKMLTADFLNSASLSEFGCNLHELTENSQFQVFMCGILKLVSKKLEEGESAKVKLESFEEGKNMFDKKYLVAHKLNGHVWIDKTSIENFFEVEIKDEELDTIVQRSIKIPPNKSFVHPLTEYFDADGNPIKDLRKAEKEFKDIYFNSWGSASAIVNIILNPEASIDKKGTIAIKSFKDLIKSKLDVDDNRIKELIERIKNRNLSGCLEACSLLKEALDLIMESQQKI